MPTRYTFPAGCASPESARAHRPIVALIAASLAFGNVKALRAKIEDAARELFQVYS